MRWLTAFVVMMLVAAGGCAGRRPAFPWDVTQLASDVSSDLRFEGITTPLLEVHPLGWRIDEGEPKGRALPPAPAAFPSVLPDRVRPQTAIALIWVRAGASTWLVVQVFRDGDDERWRRSLLYREPSGPLTRLRPGEDPQGNWHAMQRFSKPPTAREVCDFAGVSFLRPASAPTQTVSARWDLEAWRRVVDEVPPCHLPGGISNPLP